VADVGIVQHWMDREIEDLPFAIVGRGGALLGVNAVFAALLQTDVDDLCRRNLFDFTHPDDAEWARPLNLALFADMGPAVGVRDVRVAGYRLRPRDGRVVAARVAIRCFPPPADERLPIFNIVVVLPDSYDPAPPELERHFATRPPLTPGLVEAPARAVERPNGKAIVAQVTFRRAGTQCDSPNALSSSDSVLSPRELEVVALVGAGLHNAEIARRLFVTEDAIKKRLQSVFRKLSLRDRVAVALYATRQGIDTTI
jgi:DNA-binding CsgD family transcriptional regulator